MASLSTTTPLQLSDPKFDELTELVQKSYPQACILWIETVHTPSVERRFNQRCKQLAELTEKDEPTILQLYHGTSNESIKAICDNGWKSLFNRRAVHGSGSYFATTARYSSAYGKPDPTGVCYMFVADVAIGRLGYHQIPTNVDTYVNSKANPTIYVARDDRDALPRYIVAYDPVAASKEHTLIRSSKKKRTTNTGDEEKLLE